MNPITKNPSETKEPDLKALYAATATLHDNIHETLTPDGSHNLKAFNPQNFFKNLMAVLNLVVQVLPAFIPGFTPPAPKENVVKENKEDVVKK